MDIPNKAYEAVFLYNSFSWVSYFPRADSDKAKTVKLPSWLANLIREEVSRAKEAATEATLSRARTALGIDEEIL